MWVGEVKISKCIQLGVFEKLCRLRAKPRDLLAGQMVELADKRRITLVEYGMEDGINRRSFLASRRA